MDYQKRLLDKSNETSNALWAALITVNGLLVAAAAIVASPTLFDRIVLSAMVVAAARACLPLVFCYVLVQAAYDDIADSFLKKLSDIENECDSDADEEIEIEEKLEQGRWKKRQEKWAFIATGFNYTSPLAIVLIDCGPTVSTISSL